jgi:hypothetical protein
MALDNNNWLPWAIAGLGGYLLFFKSGSSSARTGGGSFSRGQVPQQFAPYSREAINLFTEAARRAGLPAAWGSADGLHYVLDHESSGWVGRPNYRYEEVYGEDAHKPRRAAEVWPQVWAELREGRITSSSSATGLGQMKLDKVRRWYPDGVNGIGDPMNEAIGMLRYIEDRYDTPEIAGRYYALPKCVNIGIDPETYQYANGDVGVRYSKRALSEYGGPDCKRGGGY